MLKAPGVQVLHQRGVGIHLLLVYVVPKPLAEARHHAPRNQEAVREHALGCANHRLPDTSYGMHLHQDLKTRLLAVSLLQDRLRPLVRRAPLRSDDGLGRRARERRQEEQAAQPPALPARGQARRHLRGARHRPGEARGGRVREAPGPHAGQLDAVEGVLRPDVVGHVQLQCARELHVKRGQPGGRNPCEDVVRRRRNCLGAECPHRGAAAAGAHRSSGMRDPNSHKRRIGSIRGRCGFPAAVYDN
mmetsp:Transcript_79067/g.221688  ORF Transcript_79067/g.221688 Transcript_79067/m.221688 type:complete len:246 (+) Transcript_79067:270-1007(+)